MEPFVPLSETISEILREHGIFDEIDVNDAAVTPMEIDPNEIVKEETDTGEEALINTICVKQDLERVPLVYTTKLDDMEIFKKNFNTLTAYDVVENILLESKPKLIEPFKNKTEYICVFDAHPFFQLVNKIQQFNKLCTIKKSYTEKKITRLVSSSKKNICIIDSEDSEEENIPLKKIVPGKVARNPSKVPSLKPCTIVLEPTGLCCTLDGMNFYDIYDAKKEPQMNTFTKGVYYKTGPCCVLLIKNLKTKCLETCIIWENLSISYVICEIDRLTRPKTQKAQKDLKKAYSLVATKKYFGLMINECCWTYREYALKHLLLEKGVCLDFLDKPHPCSGYLCECCCGTHINNNIQDLIPVDSLARASQVNPNYNFIDDVLQYTRKLSGQNIYINPADIVKERAGVQIFEDYSQLTDLYELTPQGSVVKHIQIKSKNLTTQDASNNFQKTIKLTADSNQVFCCWHKRDAMIQSFEYKNVPMITQFIRTPHPCPLNRCSCCCKPVPSCKSLLKVENSADPKYAPQHANKYLSVIKQRRNFVAKHKKNIKSEPKNVVLNSQEQHSYEPIDSNVDFKELFQIDDDKMDKTIDAIIAQNKFGKQIATPILSTTPRLPTLPEAYQRPFLPETARPSGLLKPVRPPRQPQPIRSPGLPQTAGPSGLSQSARPPRPASTAIIVPRTLLAPQPPVLVPSLPIVKEVRSLAPNHLQPVQIPITSANPLNNISVHPNIPPSHLHSAPSPFANTPIANDITDPTVGTLVNSILQRFKDVRLIVSPDGDVSAALNMPMHMLSTPELQLLSKILTHAKQQVKALKDAGLLNTSANTIVNPWQTDLENNKTNNDKISNVQSTNTKKDTIVDPLLLNVDVQSTSNCIPEMGSINTASVSTKSPVIVQGNAPAPTKKLITILPKPTVSVPTPRIIGRTPERLINNVIKQTTDRQTRNNLFRCYSNLCALKINEYLASCKSYLNDEKVLGPKIQEVFSLNAAEVENNKAQAKNKSTIEKKQIGLNVQTAGVKRKRITNLKKESKKPKMDSETDLAGEDEEMATLTPIPKRQTDTSSTAADDPVMALDATEDTDQLYVPVQNLDDPLGDISSNDENCILGF